MSSIYHGEDRFPCSCRCPTIHDRLFLLHRGLRLARSQNGRWQRRRSAPPECLANRPQNPAAGASRDLDPPAMHSVVTGSETGRRFNVVVLLDKDCVVNKGNHSIRGGTHGDRPHAPDRPTADRLTHPLLYGHSRLPTTWTRRSNWGARVIKANMDRWGPRP